MQEDKPVSISIPVKLTGNSIGILNGGKLNLVMRQLTVRCLPKDLPDNIVIDITALKIGQSVRIESLDTENVEFLHPKDGVFPEKLNAGRVGVGNVSHSIGKNAQPVNVKFTGKNTFDS